jgi:2,5-diamino-6-(ribosylamino)-4(3H)-pyrimidinone 5'-phosphate reductase
VIIHVATSLDGRIEGFEPDLVTYYGLISSWGEDLTLCGSETILAAGVAEGPPDAEPIPQPDQGDERPLLAIVDSRGRVRSWGGLLATGHWRAGIAICAEATPATHREYLGRIGVETLVAGDERVELVAALDGLAERGIETVRIDAGPTLNGVALRAGLVDEVSVLTHPALGAGRTFVDQLDAAIGLRPIAAEERGEGLIWARYEVETASA